MKKFLPHKKIIYMSLAFKEEREKNRSSLDQNRILFVGRIEPLKGIKYLLEALDALHKEQIPFTCDIVGIIEDENYYQDLLSFINERKMQDIIAFKGHIFDKTELNSYYQRSSCFVFPSLHEGFGMVLIEAMSFGLPVVAFNNSAMPYTIKHGINGFLAENQNSMDLKEYVKSVLLDKNLRETMGAEAIKTYLQSKTFKELDQEIDILCQTNFTSVVL
jgi:glycosyltransferase involved in cell wall biosynthesis